MQKIDITTTIESWKPEELPAQLATLVEAAKKATDNSYAPYSRFHVGAAIQLADGTIITGANQENAAFGAGTCAERAALYAAASSHPGMAVSRIAIAAREETKGWTVNPISPCGICRQALIETENLHGGAIQVILVGRDEIYVAPSAASLLPFCFTEF